MSATATSINQPQTLTELERELKRQQERLASSDEEERRDAVLRLGNLKRPDASRIASSALRDEAAIVRATATRAVLSLDDREAATLLLPLLRDRNEFVRQETAYAIGETRSQAATAELIVALKRDRSPGVRGAATLALGMIGDRAAVPELTAALTRQVRASGLLNRIRRRQTDENEFVRRSAAQALGQIADRRAVPALIEVLADERTPNDVRRESAHALGRIGDAAAIPTLHRLLTTVDPYLSQAASEAIGKLK